MENQNFIRGSETDAVATKVIRELSESNFVTREQEEDAAGRFERMNGRLLRRSWESLDEFAARAVQTDIQPTAARTLVMSPDRAASELRRLERATKNAPSNTEEQRRILAQEQASMNEFRRVLHIPEIDYSEPQNVEVPRTDKVAKAFAKFVTHPEAERLELVSKLRDLDYIRTVAAADESEEVRQAALERLAVMTAEK